ncbi:MAG: hypothetical protein RMY29_034190 [Nostoc sp. CreGUA01]|nr:hypothetical protein [Nostoc sp. CreGUA01]
MTEELLLSSSPSSPPSPSSPSSPSSPHTPFPKTPPEQLAWSFSCLALSSLNIMGKISTWVS